MEESPLSPPFDALFRDFLDPLSPDRVLAGVLSAVSDEKSRPRELASLILEDRHYAGYLFAQSFLAERLKEWRTENEGQPERDRILLERLLGLLGKAAVRNLISCARIERLLGTEDPQAFPAEDRKISATPSKLVPFALEAERLCEDRGWISPAAAFAAGLQFDSLAALLKRNGGGQEEKAALDASFKEGVQIAEIAYRLGHRIKQIRPADRLFSSALLLPIGKALMAKLYPKSAGDRAWVAFQKACDSAGAWSMELAELSEPRRFKISHWELSSLIANFSQAFGQVEQAIYFARDPERLRRARPELFPLCCLLSVSSRLSKAKAGPPRLESYHLRWLDENDLDPAALVRA